MAEKEKTGLIKLQIAAGQANPAPPVGPALGQHGVNIMDFCNAFNEKTKELQGMLTPVIITVYKDRSFTFETKSPPASTLIMKELKMKKGSQEPNKDKVGKITTVLRAPPAFYLPLFVGIYHLRNATTTL